MKLLVQSLTIEELCQHLLNFRDAGRATDENYFVDLLLRQIGICERLWKWLHTALKDRL